MAKPFGYANEKNTPTWAKEAPIIIPKVDGSIRFNGIKRGYRKIGDQESKKGQDPKKNPHHPAKQTEELLENH